MQQIECTDIFTDVEWAQVHVGKGNEMRMNIQQNRHIQCVHVDIDKLAAFVDNVRSAQKVQQSKLVTT